MVKDRKARRQNQVTALAVGNMIAALVDTMMREDLGNDVAHHFLDRLQDLNSMTLHGPALFILDDIVDVVRGTVPVND
jgi:predicted nucleic acid-binding protein